MVWLSGIVRSFAPLPSTRRLPLRSERLTSRSRRLTSSPTRRPVWRRVSTIAWSRTCTRGFGGCFQLAQQAVEIAVDKPPRPARLFPHVLEGGDGAIIAAMPILIAHWQQERRAASLRLIVAGAQCWVSRRKVRKSRTSVGVIAVMVQAVPTCSANQVAKPDRFAAIAATVWSETSRARTGGEEGSECRQRCRLWRLVWSSWVVKNGYGSSFLGDTREHACVAPPRISLKLVT